MTRRRCFPRREDQHAQAGHYQSQHQLAIELKRAQIPNSVKIKHVKKTLFFFSPFGRGFSPFRRGFSPFQKYNKTEKNASKAIQIQN